MYNAEEVYRIGIEIEKNGRLFYRRSADKSDDPDLKRLFKELAAWEESHVSLFEQLASELPQNATSGLAMDPDGDMDRYLKASADSHVFRLGQEGFDALVDGCRTAQDALKLALRFEKDSVGLYRALQDAVPEELGKKTIERLAREETSHVTLIHEKLVALGEPE